MANTQVSTRLPDDVLQRIEHLKAAMIRKEDDATIGRGDVVRRALLRGLRALEEELFETNS